MSLSKVQQRITNDVNKTFLMLDPDNQEYITFVEFIKDIGYTISTFLILQGKYT